MQEKREEFREQFQMLGLRIALYRKKAGLTQEQFAEKAGCSWSFISRIEANNGKIITGASLYTIFKMAQVLNVPVSKLFEE